MKQETLEEASYNYASTKINRTSHLIGFREGAKYEKQRIYNQIKELYDNENITGFSKLAYAKCLDIVEQFDNK